MVRHLEAEKKSYKIAVSVEQNEKYSLMLGRKNMTDLKKKRLKQ